MKTTLYFLLLLMCLPAHALGGETITKVVKSEVPMIVDGNWVYPPFTIVLTDSNITVNGFPYMRPKKKDTYPPEKPDREKDFLNWVVRTPADSAQALIDSGGSYEEALKIMKDFIFKYADGDTLKVKCGDGSFTLKYYKCSLPVHVSTPRQPRSAWYPPDNTYRKGWLEPQLLGLLNQIKNGYFVIAGDGYGQAFSRRTRKYAIDALKNMSREELSNLVSNNEHLFIQGESQDLKISRSTLKDLLNPRK